MEILTFARTQGQNPSEINALIVSGGWIVAADVIAHSINELMEAVKVDQSDAIVDIADAIRSNSRGRKDADAED
jgi:hypothetical protein